MRALSIGSRRRSGSLGGGYAYFTSATGDADTTVSVDGLTVTHSPTDAAYRNVIAPHGRRTGKWYFEVTVNTLGGGGELGIIVCTLGQSCNRWGGQDGWGSFIVSDGRVGPGSLDANIGAWSAGDIIRVGVNADDRQLTMARNGGTPVVRNMDGNMANTALALFVMAGVASPNGSLTFNFGASAFTYTPYSGHTGWTAVASPLPARYWRYDKIRGAVRQGAIAEIEMRTSIGGADALTGGTASASQFYTGAAGYGPASACDNDTSTKWVTDWERSTWEWWQYDFGAGNEKDIKQVMLQPTVAADAVNYGEPAEFWISASNDGVVFQPIRRFAPSTPWGYGEQRSFTL